MQRNIAEATTQELMPNARKQAGSSERGRDGTNAYVFCVMNVWPGGDGLRIIAPNVPKRKDTAHRRGETDHITRKRRRFRNPN